MAAPFGLGTRARPVVWLLVALALAPLGLRAEEKFEPPARIAVAGGELAEIIAALGAADRVVGVDTSTLYPPELALLPSIGYARALSAEKVLSLAPDMLIGEHGAGPSEALRRIGAAGARVELAPEGEGPDAVPGKIAFVAALLGLGPRGEDLAEAYRSEMDAVAAEVGGLGERPRVLFVLTLRDGVPVVGGAGTAADAMITLAGGVNAARDAVAGYAPLSRTALLATAPDVLLTMDGQGGGAGKASEALLAQPELARSPAGLAKRVVTMDGTLLLGFGPRTPDGVRDLAQALRPRQAAPAAP